MTRANKIDDALATRNFRDLLQKASRPRVSEKPPEKAPEDVPVDPGVDPPVDPPFNPGTLPPVVPDTAYRDDVPRPMTTGEREKYAAALGPAPQKSLDFNIGTRMFF